MTGTRAIADPGGALPRGSNSIPLTDPFDVLDRPDALADSRGHVAVEGWWDGVELRVEQLARPRRTTATPRSTYEPRWTVPPCPEPETGWPCLPDDVENLLYDDDDLQATAGVVSAVTFRPSPRQAVLVIAATDVEQVRAALEPQLRGALCVVPSQWTRAELDSVRTRLRQNADRWHVDRITESYDERAQPTIVVKVIRVDESMVDWADTVPDDLLDVYAALRPATS